MASNPDHIVPRTGFAVQTGLTAATTQTQVGAATVPLNYGLNLVSVVGTDNDVVQLPPAVTGAVCIIKNSDAAQDVDFFPATGDSIDAEAVNANATSALGEGLTRIYVAVSDTNWQALTV